MSQLVLFNYFSRAYNISSSSSLSLSLSLHMCFFLVVCEYPFFCSLLQLKTMHFSTQINPWLIIVFIFRFFTFPFISISSIFLHLKEKKMAQKLFSFLQSVYLSIQPVSFIHFKWNKHDGKRKASTAKCVLLMLKINNSGNNVVNSRQSVRQAKKKKRHHTHFYSHTFIYRIIFILI